MPPMSDVLPNISLESVWYMLLAVSRLPAPLPAAGDAVSGRARTGSVGVVRTLTQHGGDDGAGGHADDVVEELVHGAAREPLQVAQDLDGDEAPDAPAVQRQDVGARPARGARVPHQRQRLRHDTTNNNITTRDGTEHLFVSCWFSLAPLAYLGPYRTYVPY